MYAVVGCSDCRALWIVEGSPETSECPRCGTTRRHSRRREFLTTDDPDHAREVRASMLANRQGHGDAFADLDSFDEMETRLDDAGPDDETYLAGSGIDPDTVEAAGDRAGSSGGAQSRDDVVREALRELEAPDRDAVVAYAGDRGVAADYVETGLEKLRRAGEVTESGGTYRLV
jgi:hypothetical protein